MKDARLQFVPGRRAVVGAVLGCGVGLFVSTPWGAFAADGPGLWLVLPLLVAFTLIGAWFGTVSGFSVTEHDISGAPAAGDGRASRAGDDQHHPVAA
jgi:hypothetical protein